MGSRSQVILQRTVRNTIIITAMALDIDFCVFFLFLLLSAVFNRVQVVNLHC